MRYAQKNEIKPQRKDILYMENKNAYTIKELVTVTGKDTAAIRKAISRAGIEPVNVNGQEKVYSVSDLMNVKSIAKFLNADVPAVEESVEAELDESFIGQTLPADDNGEYEAETLPADDDGEYEAETLPADDKEPTGQAPYESEPEPTPIYYPDTEFNNLLTGTSIYTKIVEPFIQLNGIDNISTDFLAAALTQLMFSETPINEAIAGMHATIDTLLSIAVKLGVVEAPVEAVEAPVETPVEDVAEESVVEPEVASEDHSEWLGVPVLDEIDDTVSDDEVVSEDEIELTDEDIEDNIDVELVQKLTDDMPQTSSGIFNPTASSEYSTIHLSDISETGSYGLLGSPEPMSANLMRSALMRVQTETETVDDEAINEDSLDESVSFRQSLFAKLGRN